MKWREIADRYDVRLSSISELLGLTKDYLRQIDDGHKSEPKYMYATKMAVIAYYSLKQNYK